MATSKTKRKPRTRRSNSGFAGIPTDSRSLQKVGIGAASAVGGALVGSAIGKLGLLPGILLLGYGALNNSVAAIAAGATLAMAPEIKSAPTSTKTGVLAIAENSVNRIKEAGKQIGQKAFLDKVAPKVFTSGVAGIEGVDYYDSSYNNALNAISGLAGDYGDSGGEIGRLAEFAHQANELNQYMSGIDGIEGVDGLEDEEMAGIGRITTSDGW